jgi:phosphonate transport system permease protein
MAAQATRDNPFPKSPWSRVAAVALLLYVVYACAQMEISWERVQVGLDNAARFFGRLFPPNFSRAELLWKGLRESPEIAVLASTLGIVLALPLGLLAARNLMPSWVTWPARLVIVLARSFHPVIVAILFVKAVGFGALAGILALTVASIGFVGKLFGEALEEAQPGPVEALTAVGAPWPSRFLFGYWPQVKPAFWSIALFRWDINVRESAVLGLVGAGGIGMALDSALNLFQWDRVALVLFAIFAIVIAAELIVTQVRRRVI